MHRKLYFLHNRWLYGLISPWTKSNIHHLYLWTCQSEWIPSVCASVASAYSSIVLIPVAVYSSMCLLWLSDSKERGADSLTKSPPPPPPTHPQQLLPSSHVPPLTLPPLSLPSHSGIKTTFCLSTIGVKHFLVSHETATRIHKVTGWVF